VSGNCGLFERVHERILSLGWFPSPTMSVGEIKHRLAYISGMFFFRRWRSSLGTSKLITVDVSSETVVIPNFTLH
jgi:hypothetical protein